MWFHSTAQVVFATWRAANSRPLHAHWWVVPFNPTGCNRYVVMVVLRAANQNQLIAGGNHTLITSMNHRHYSGCTMSRVIPFNRTGYTSNVAGGRLPPLLKFVLIAACFDASIIVLHSNKFQKRSLHSSKLSIVNCPLSIRK